MFAVFTNAFDRVSRESIVNIPVFKPTIQIAGSSRNTHFKIVTGVTEMDFENETFMFDNDETAILPY